MRFRRFVLCGNGIECTDRGKRLYLCLRHNGGNNAWIIGWDLLLEYALGAATVAIGWSGYVVSFLRDFGIVVPDIWSAAPFDFDPARGEWQRTTALINAPAMLVTALASMLLIVGIHESAKVNNIIVAIKVGFVVIFILASIWFVARPIG
jgi:basic amino acid/polyamine antiporter, APA family